MQSINFNRHSTTLDSSIGAAGAHPGPQHPLVGRMNRPTWRSTLQSSTYIHRTYLLNWNTHPLPEAGIQYQPYLPIRNFHVNNSNI